MDDTTDLDCRIYVDASINKLELLRIIAELVSAPYDRYSVATSFGIIDVLANDDYDENRRLAFPDGFLHFRYLVETYPRPDGRVESCRAVRSVLQYLWSRDMPAVATCDDEDELPERGGYKSRAIPWPVPAGLGHDG